MSSDQDAPWEHTHKATLGASIEKVFDALTSNEALRRWFADHVDVGGGGGEPYRFWGKHTWGTATESDAHQLITRWNPHSLLGYS